MSIYTQIFQLPLLFSKSNIRQILFETINHNYLVSNKQHNKPDNWLNLPIYPSPNLCLMQQLANFISQSEHSPVSDAAPQGLV